MDIYRLWTHTTDSGHTGIGQQREGIDCVLLKCESEQWTYTDRGHTTLTVDTQDYTGMGQQREGIDGVLVRLCVYESEQWTYTDHGHTTLTVDTQEWASTAKALTACYLR